ncbi:AAA family ATPase [Armatimonas sp.]|uniref:AAA family ATPase n=1 Tax=Armatimonas sp. TaxID=1872638 RepID=UPI003752B93A
MLKSLKIKNLLSFGPEGVDVELRPLNVLVGPNGSGKSNFLSAVRILQAAPTDLSMPIRSSSSFPEDWKRSDSILPSEISADLDFHSDYIGTYYLALNFINGYGIEIHSEVFKSDIFTFFERFKNNARIYFLKMDMENVENVRIEDSKSVMSEVKDFRPSNYSISASLLKSLRIYTGRPWQQGNASWLPQKIDVESKFLSEDYSNLAVVLHNLNNFVNIESLLLSKLKRFYPRSERLFTDFVGGLVQIFIRESVGKSVANIPASRLSDGTLSFLCLLTILCHPTPPPLICIEEPELGLHPDVLPMIAELLVEASKRTQLIITTHSDLLVSAIGDLMPEAILVCEHTSEEGTTIERPNPERLKKWLQQDDMSLGEVWLRGAIGGTLY